MEVELSDEGRDRWIQNSELTYGTEGGGEGVESSERFKTSQFVHNDSQICRLLDRLETFPQVFT